MWAVVAIVISLASFFMQPKVKTTSPSPGEQEGTKADEGGSICVVFGTCDVSLNFTAFKAEAPEAIQK